MKTSFELVAEFRETQGKGASRRLRHEGKGPAILMGGHAEARALTLSHQKLLIILDNDFQGGGENGKIRISLPLHFTGAAVSPGVKSQGGLVSHMRTETEVSCLPKDLPEFIEVDISGLSLNESVHLSQLKIPPGVTLVELAKDDVAVVAIHSPRAEDHEPTAAAGARAV